MKLNPDGKTGVIQLTATIDANSHIYAQSQPHEKDGSGPQETTIVVTPNPQFKLSSKFLPTPKPKTHIDKEAWPGLEMQEFHSQVTWSASFAVEPNAAGKPIAVQGVVKLQSCDDAKGTCVSLDLPFKANSAGKTNAVAVKPPAKPTNPIDKSKAHRSDDRAHIGFVITAESATVHPGSNVTLFITALPDTSWHIYERHNTAPQIAWHTPDAYFTFSQ